MSENREVGKPPRVGRQDRSVKWAKCQERGRKSGRKGLLQASAGKPGEHKAGQRRDMNPALRWLSLGSHEAGPGPPAWPLSLWLELGLAWGVLPLSKWTTTRDVEDGKKTQGR